MPRLIIKDAEVQITKETNPYTGMPFFTTDTKIQKYNIDINIEELDPDYLERQLKLMKRDLRRNELSDDERNDHVTNNAYIDYLQEKYRLAFHGNRNTFDAYMAELKESPLFADGSFLDDMFNAWFRDDHENDWYSHGSRENAKEYLLRMFVYRLIDEQINGRLKKKDLTLDTNKNSGPTEEELKKDPYLTKEQLKGYLFRVRKNDGIFFLKEALSENNRELLRSFEAQKKEVNSKEHLGKVYDQMSKDLNDDADAQRAKINAEYYEKEMIAENEYNDKEERLQNEIKSNAKIYYKERADKINAKAEGQKNNVAGRFVDQGQAMPENDKNYKYIQHDKKTGAYMNEINTFQNKEETDPESLNERENLSKFAKGAGLDLTEDEKAILSQDADDVINSKRFGAFHSVKNDSKDFRDIKTGVRNITQYMNMNIVNRDARDRNQEVSFETFSNALKELEKNAKNYIRSRQGLFGKSYDWDNMDIDGYLNVERGYKFYDSGKDRLELAKNALLITKVLKEKLETLQTEVQNQNNINNVEVDEQKLAELDSLKKETREKFTKEYLGKRDMVRKEYEAKRQQIKAEQEEKRNKLDKAQMKKKKGLGKTAAEKVKEESQQLDHKIEKEQAKIDKINSITDEEAKKFANEAIDKFDIKIQTSDFDRATKDFGSQWFIAKLLIGAAKGKTDEPIDPDDREGRTYGQYIKYKEAVKEESKKTNKTKETRQVTSGGMVRGL